jgi:YVTN family beta-propeller protein
MQDVLILNQKLAHSFSYYDLETGKELHRIKFPDYPHEFAVDSQNRYAYVGHYGIETHMHQAEGGNEIFVVDIAAAKHVRTLSVWPFRRVHGLVMDEQDRLYALSEGNSTLLIFDNPREQDVPNRALPSGGYKSHLIAVSKDGKHAFCTNLLSNTVTYLQPQDPTFAPLSIFPGLMPEGNCFSADEKTFYVSNRQSETVVSIDVATLKVTSSARTRTDPTRVYRAGQGRLLVTNYGENSISVFNEALEPLGILGLDHRPIGMSFHPQEPFAYVSFKGDHLGVLDLERLRVDRMFPTLSEPDVSAVVRI